MRDHLKRLPVFFLLWITSLIISHRCVVSKSVLREKRGLTEDADPVNPACSTNWCEMGLGLCAGGETCVFHASNCTASCKSAQVVTTPITLNSNNNSTTTTADEERLCGDELKCVNGICDANRLKEGSPRCICDAGFTGVDCTQTCSNHCEVYDMCLNEGTCIYNQTTCLHSCECKAGFGGRHCGKKIMNTSTPSTQHPPTTEIISHSTAEDKTCSGLYDCGPEGVCNKEVVDNQEKFTCICNRGFVGLVCTVPCKKYCGAREVGICRLAEDGVTETCSCKYPYTGDGCEDIIPNKPVSATASWVWWVVGSCSVLLVILVVLLIALPYWMWRRREVFIMKVVYYFQPYEDDDGKLFDAFVSYKSSEEDERFVLKTLYPRLEKELNFKLCLHQRDFLPGETIANNIIWAIENSRRTILVLSPNFLKSEFTRFEYQKAQHEMLKLKHKIIPIILEDISSDKDTMDGTLKNILESITYLEWPQDPTEKSLKKFWKRLELSLPKKRIDQSSKDNKDNNTSYDERYTKLESGYQNTAVELSITDDEKSMQKTEDGSISFITDSDMSAGDGTKNESSINDAFRTIQKLSETSSDAFQHRNNDIKRFFQEPENNVTFEKLRNQAAQYENQLDLSNETDDSKV